MRQAAQNGHVQPPDTVAAIVDHCLELRNLVVRIAGNLTDEKLISECFRILANPPVEHYTQHTGWCAVHQCSGYWDGREDKK